MGAAKAVALWAEQVTGSSVVTTMCRNGTTYGIRLAGDPQMFLAPGPTGRGRLVLRGLRPAERGQGHRRQRHLGTRRPRWCGRRRLARRRGIRRRHDGGRGRGHRADGHRSAPGAAPGSSCRRGTTPAHQSASTFVESSRQRRRRGSPPASCTPAPASGRSAPASRPHQRSASRPRCGPLPSERPGARVERADRAYPLGWRHAGGYRRQRLPDHRRRARDVRRQQHRATADGSVPGLDQLVLRPGYGLGRPGNTTSRCPT